MLDNDDADNENGADDSSPVYIIHYTYCTIVVTTHNEQTVRKYRVFDLNSELFCWLSYSVIVGLN